MDQNHDPYDEEFHAEIRNHLTWCYGRLEELRLAGVVKGPPTLTASGWSDYQALVASGFVPDRAKAIWTLQGCEDVPPELVEQLVSLILRA